MEKINVQTQLHEENCTGCGLCSLICPVNAISLKSNDIATPVCRVNEYCIECGKCIKLCPQLNQTSFYSPIKCYAAYPQKQYSDKMFSSGGAATLLARKFLEKYNGVVCGCTWDYREKCAKHVIVSSINDLALLCGSKYVQSDIQNVFSDIKYHEKRHKNILFIGTPCQVNAVKNYCNSEYLYTIDLICHGTPPANYLTEYINSLSVRNKIYDLRFRGERDFYLSIKDQKNKEIYCQYKDCDPYFHAFLEGTIYRENCYTCKYATLRRCGDITLGDFWGLERQDISYTGNISIILGNTNKGEELIHNTQEYLVLDERTVDDAVKGNLQLVAPMPVTERRNEFICYFEKTGSFIKAFKKTKTYKEAIKTKRRMNLKAQKHNLKLLLEKFKVIGE